MTTSVLGRKVAGMWLGKRIGRGGDGGVCVGWPGVEAVEGQWFCVKV